MINIQFNPGIKARNEGFNQKSFIASALFCILKNKVFSSSGKTIKGFAAILFFILCTSLNIFAVDTTTYISPTSGEGYFPLSISGQTAAIFVSNSDDIGVMRAAKDLQNDLTKVTDATPMIYTDKIPEVKYLVIAGTIDKSPAIDKLIETGKLDVTSVKGKWETFVIQLIDDPLPGVGQALVIAGSDKRGTIFGIYDVSEKIGVSPWYWWADVPVKKQSELYVIPGRYSQGEPAVKYRGIFINDEAPALSGWVEENYGGFNSKFYVKVFELILRLKGNYLWPAMWGRAFYVDDPLNPKLADEYGVVIGTSHHEPMMRAHQEWALYGKGPWNYETNAEVLRDFWRKSIEERKDYESIVTVGMRGDGDEPMSEGTAIALLEKIVADQRKILEEVTGKKADEIPQKWALYKEVQDYYDKGMRVPEDITLLLCDDNWGNVRILPKPGSAPRKGGYGMYYHYDFVGGPVSYRWLNNNPLPKIWEQMNLTYRYGVDEIWIVNVGDIKPMEYPIEFFLDLAWNPDKWPAEKLPEYALLWAEEQFGKEYAPEIADIMTKYTKYNGRRTPEMLKPDTYSLLHYREAERVVEDYNTLATEAEAIYNDLGDEYKDAYYQLVLFPVLACANLNELYVTVGKNHLYAKQGRVRTNELAVRAKDLFDADAELTDYYHNVMAEGKWNHMMSQIHIGYTSWNQPDSNIMPEVMKIEIPDKAEMGVSIEGSDKWWPKEQGEAVLPVISPYSDDYSYFEIFNRGSRPFDYTIETGEPWLKVTSDAGTIENEQRFVLRTLWTQAPEGTHRVPVTITGPDDSKVTLTAVVQIPTAKEREEISGFVENNGYISIEAPDYTREVDKSPVYWEIIPDMGRTGSSVTPFPVTMAEQTPGGNDARLEYDIYTFSSGDANVDVYVSPTLNFLQGEGLKYGISMDDGPVQTVNINEGETVPDWKYPEWWNRSVTDHIKIKTTKFNIDKPGKHTLKLWTIDPGIVFQKIVIDTGGLQPSYLGPPESVDVGGKE